MIFYKRPENFNSKMEVAACYLEFEGKILLLLRQNDKPEEKTWCLPAGKIENGLNVIQTICKEVEEETHINILPEPGMLKYFGHVFVRYPDKDFIFHIFSTKFFHKPPKITLNKIEHRDYRWVTPEEALKMKLIEDQDVCIKLFYYIS